MEATWPIFRIHHQRSRYIYELYYVREQISRELYDWLLRQGYGDAALIAKWKKPGYEKLCCLRCVQTRNHNFGTVCICRIPTRQLDEDTVVECQNCGCHGCATGDVKGRGGGRKARRARMRAERAAESGSAVVQYLNQQDASAAAARAGRPPPPMYRESPPQPPPPSSADDLGPPPPPSTQ